MTDQIAVVVAVGPLDRAKSRLGPDLDANDRRRLVLAMLQDVLSAINEAHSGPLFVVTPDPEVDPVAGTYGALILRDAGEGTNAAIETAIVDDRVASAKAVLVVQGDLPQIGAEDLRQCLDALGASEPMGVGWSRAMMAVRRSWGFDRQRRWSQPSAHSQASAIVTPRRPPASTYTSYR